MMNQFIKHNLLLPLLILPILISNGAKPITAAEATYTPYQVVNGGFETGDLTGWTRYSIWKGESGMAAFDPSLVTSSGYFGGNYPYGRDGSYNLGIVSSGTTNWNQNEERMGYLRSSDFVLGGTGWISFKLGGGKQPSFTYLSVHKSSDNTEVARFANRWWNDTTEASAVAGSTISNAEAFMFPYYFDLSTINPSIMGSSLYFLLCDTAAYNWTILSADSFVTYYSAAPTPTANRTANNILPTVLHTADATNSILNGYFDSNLNEWTNVDSVFQRDSGGFALSSVGGNTATGILRSSAFVTTSSYDHIRFDWAGILRLDKRLFISVKEVGTNIEMLRFVRRDNLSGKQNGDFDNHLLDLTSLSTSKSYYLEFADNDDANDDWGVTKFDSIRFITDTEYDGITSGDRAVIISPMATAFPGTALTTAQEAAAYGSDFVTQTASYCSTLDGGTMATDGKWTVLANAYGTLSSAAKDYFVAGGTTDANVVAARNRYVVLVQKYSALKANNFLMSSGGTLYQATLNGGAVLENPSNLSGVLIIIIGVTLLAGVSYISIRKKRTQN